MMHARDPFAREELHSTREYLTHADTAGCPWCGGIRSVRYADPNSRRYLYRFRVETDGGCIHEDQHLFCSRQCRADYFS